MLNDDICNVWQSQGPVSAPPSLEEIRRMAGKFHSQIARRNSREYLVSVVMLVYFGRCAWISPLPLMRAGNLLVMAGLVYMVYQLHRRTSPATAPGDMGAKSCAAFHRAELERQRDALCGVWRWYLGPLIPGLAMIVMAGCISGFRRSMLLGVLSLACAGVVALGLWWLGRINRRAAAKIQKQIDTLDAATTAG